MDGFYEPHKIKGVKIKENYFIYSPESRLFSLGILVSPWLNEDNGEIIKTFSVLTTKANSLLEEIHNEKKRMPLIIAPEDRDNWLLTEGKENIQSFMKPF